MKRVIVIFGLLLMMIGAVQAQLSPVPTTDASTIFDQTYIRSPQLGITFVSSAQAPQDDTRYQNALSLGAGRNRWPLYWPTVEPQPGQFNWADYDRLVSDDMRFRMQSLAVLLGRPGFAQDGDSITGLNEPIFADGSDFPEPGKALNPNNPWATFVYAAVDRYRPGGVLARELGWPAGIGIKTWEMWNEPDLEQFWHAGVRAYARLLKVGYLAAKQADPTATVIFGGLLYSTDSNWLARVLDIYIDDPNVEANNWYMDAVAVHNYSYPWRSGWLTLVARETFDAYDIDKPIWVTESGVSVWDDYPGPVWAATDEDARFKRATQQQQAWFIIQSTAYAWYEGASVVFFLFLYYYCGDQAAGTNFAPHTGELCLNGDTCAGDAYGLFRNPIDAACYSQHPQPNTPRPAATAFRLLADIFGREPFQPEDIVRSNDVTRITFSRPGELIHVIWNHRLESNAAVFPASGSTALLYTLDGDNRPIRPDSEGDFRVNLAAAQEDAYPQREARDPSAIGGPPIIIVEAAEGELLPPTPTLAPTPTDTPSPSSPLNPTPGPLIPADGDTEPPVTFMSPLPETSLPSFQVNWGANDDSPIERYLIWVQVDGGEWKPWLETRETSGVYSGQSGSYYAFAAWALDAAGNWSGNLNLTPQVITRVE
ncbi:MAG: hypothetical protein KC546_14135 [Anaerolineae bacterium]|nr:hypothetical protein [Anaerolineae bacterium]